MVPRLPGPDQRRFHKLSSAHHQTLARAHRSTSSKYVLPSCSARTSCDLIATIRDIEQGHGITDYMLLLAAYYDFERDRAAFCGPSSPLVHSRFMAYKQPIFRIRPPWGSRITSKRTDW